MRRYQSPHLRPDSLFVVLNNLGDIQANWCEHLWNHTSAFVSPPHDQRAGQQQFHQEAETALVFSLFELYQTVEGDWELELDVVDMKSTNLLKFDAALKVFNFRK